MAKTAGNFWPLFRQPHLHVNCANHLTFTLEDVSTDAVATLKLLLPTSATSGAFFSEGHRKPFCLFCEHCTINRYVSGARLQKPGLQSFLELVIKGWNTHTLCCRMT